MGSRSKDPFNFDDIYRQAGVEDLFVKKSLSEMKKGGTPSPGATRVDTSKPASNGAIPAVGAQSSSPRMSTAAPVRAPVQSSSPSASVDPFASLGISQLNLNSSTGTKSSAMHQNKTTQPAAKPAASQPIVDDLGFLGGPTAPSTKPPAQSHTTIDAEFDDIFGSPVRQTSKPVARQTPVAANDDPFALFGGIAGADEPILTSAGHPAATATLVSNQQPATVPNRVPPQQPRGPDVSSSTSRVDNAQPVQLRTSSSSDSLKASGPATSAPAKPSVTAELPTPAPPPPSYVHSLNAPTIHQSPYLRQASPHAHQDEALETQTSSKSSGTIGGVLKMLGKTSKTVIKAAKEGLQTGMAQLNEALERMDHAEKFGAPRPYRSSDGEEAQLEFPAEKALDYAITISEMPPKQQEEMMGRLPRHVRIKVAEILREQAMVEAEGALREEPPAFAGNAHESRPAVPPRAAPEPQPVRTHDVRADEQPPAPAPSPQQAAETPAPARTKAPAPAHNEDFLGISSTPAPLSKPTPTPAAAPVVQQDDLLGFVSAPAAPAAQQAPVHVADVDSVGDFFGGGAAAAPPAAPPPSKPRHTVTPSSESLDAFFSGGDSKPASQQRPAAQQVSRPVPFAAGLVHGPASTAASGLAKTAPTGPLFTDHNDDPDEPEQRKMLRRKRLEDKERQMKEALEAKIEKEKKEAHDRELQVTLKDKYKEGILAWKNKNKDNVRGLLGSLQTVLWENSGWVPMGMGDLLEPAQVRKAWMKANLIVHPDKVRQKNGTPDQVAIADMVFDVLKDGWNKFQK